MEGPERPASSRRREAARGLGALHACDGGAGKKGGKERRTKGLRKRFEQNGEEKMGDGAWETDRK